MPAEEGVVVVEREISDEALKRRRRRHADIRGLERVIMPDIFERMAEGESLSNICTQENYSRSTINLWCHREEWRTEYLQAREALGAWWGDRVVEAAETAAVERDHAKIQGIRVLVDALKWSASRLNFRVYGDRLDVTSDGKAVGGVIMLPPEVSEPVDGVFEIAPPDNLLPPGE